MSVRPPVLRRRLCTAVAMAFLSIAVAHAGDLALDIPAQDMGGAINLLARQANVQILFATNLVDGKRSPALKGGYTPEAALRTLLAGSGLEFKANGDGTFALRPAQPPKKHDGTADQQLAEMVVSATRTANPLDKIAASLSVVTQDDFDEVQASTVSHVMKKLPNVEFGGGPRVNGEVPTVRGVFGASLTLLVDGARQNDTTSPGMKSPLYLDPYFLKQAEVLRGSASSLYGSGGIGGLMTFTTLSARDLLAPGQTLGGGIKAGHATADGSDNLNARIYAANDGADGLLALGKHDWNKVRQGGGSYLDPNDGNSATGLVKLGIQPIKDGRIELSHQFYRSQNLQVNNPQATDYKTANLPIDKPAIQLTHIDQSNSVLKGLFGNAGGAPAVVATVYRADLKIIADKSPDPTITNVLYSNSRTITDGASVQGTLMLGAADTVQHRLTGGIDYFKDRQFAVSASAANPSAPSTVIRDGNRKVTGIFVQDEIALGESWSLTPSLRSDHYDAALGDNSLAPNGAGRLSPKLALAWNDKGLMLYGSFGEAFRAPTVNELYQNYTGFGLTNFLPNAGLKPEIDKTAEIGADFRRKNVFAERDTLKLRVSVFDSRATDLIYSTNLGGMAPAGSTPAQQATYAANCAATGLNCKLQYQNIPNAKRTGGEIEGGYGIDLWQFNAAYSRVRITDSSSGNGLFSPPDKFSLQVRRQLPRESVAVFWNTTAIASQDYDATVLRRRPGYATHDLFLSWAPTGQRYKIDAGVGNLFDKRYSAYQSSNAYAYTYQEGRSLKVSLGMDF